MKMVSSACGNLPEELRGKFYPIKGMTEIVRKQLVEDHFLFDKGDRFLEAAGMNSDWPKGRAVFVNNQKTLLIWVNEEDHLRVISMSSGADIKPTFERLIRASSFIENVG